jgi:hypothetical protein
MCNALKPWTKTKTKTKIRNCKKKEGLKNSQQQKPQFPELLFQPYVRSVYACALAPASADIAVLDTTREHRLNLGPASSENFRHTAQEGMLSHTHYCRSRIALRRLALSSPDQGDSKELHSQVQGGSKAHQNLVPGGDDGDYDATSSILSLSGLLESEPPHVLQVACDSMSDLQLRKKLSKI